MHSKTVILCNIRDTNYSCSYFKFMFIIYYPFTVLCTLQYNFVIVLHFFVYLNIYYLFNY